jgi:serine protease Do
MNFRTLMLPVLVAAALAGSGDELIPLQVIRGGDVRILYLERYWLTADATEHS